MRDISIDIETYSSVNIKTGGLYKYAQAPDFTVLLFAYSIDGAPVQVIDCASGEGFPSTLLCDLFAPDVRLHAFNAAFEWYCLSRYFRLTEQQSLEWLPMWHCTQLHGLYCGYPAGLAACGAALGLPDDKAKSRTGTALIKYFCVPCEPTAKSGHRTRNLPKHDADRWQLFKDYNARDVVAEMEIERRLSAFPVPEYVRQGWITDQIINTRGVAVDIDLVGGALNIDAEVRSELIDEAVELTGLSNPNSITQLADWLRFELDDEDIITLRKADVSELLGKELSSDTARRMLRIRQELGKTSVKKYAAIDDAECGDGRLRGLLMYYGANRTGRWAGRLVQPQNLPRTHLPCIDLAREVVRSGKTNDIEKLRLLYGNVPDALSQLVRTALIAPSGKQFIDADFSAIEARVVAWLAGERWVLDVFRTHGRIYEATAAQMFGVPLELIVKGKPEYALRQKGKVATLALGYGGSSGALIAMGALSMGLREEELPDIVDRWRAANPRICDLWHAVEGAALDTLKTGQPHYLPHLSFALVGDGARAWLSITLPSGRALMYANPRLGTDKWGRDSLVYDGGKAFVATETWGGKLVENIVQATARDCLAEAVERLETAGYPIVFHVHDEVIVEATPGQTLEDVCAIMSVCPAWADGLPLNADGWVGKYYTKD